MIFPCSKIIIIVGCQRSGTTLCGQILGAHEHTLLIDEADELYSWFHAAVGELDCATSLWQNVLEKAQSKYVKPEMRIKKKNSEYSLADGITTLVLKAPNLTFDFEAISQLNCLVHIIYPVRDPRSVVASMARSPVPFVANQLKHLKRVPAVGQIFSKDASVLADETNPAWIRAAKVWAIKSNLASEFSKRGLPVFSFKYENLVMNPKPLIDEFLAFCGLPISNSPYHHEAIYQGYGPGKTHRERSIYTKSLDNWSSVLENDQEEAVLNACAPHAASFGYCRP